MKRFSAILLAAGLILCASAGGGDPATPTPLGAQATTPAPAITSNEGKEATPMAESAAMIPLPPVKTTGAMPLEDSLARRRSAREFSALPITLEEAGQLLWAAQGVTDPQRGYRTAPSAGALFPLEVYLVAGKVEGLPAGVYTYDPRRHGLKCVATGDKRADLCRVALDQDPVRKAAVDIVIAAVVARTEAKYGSRAERYVHMEVGHAGQNVLLQAVARGLGAVPIGAFDDKDVKRVLGLPPSEDPFYIIPIGPVR